uniref:FAD dependent oxidoreductase domain-containing protein n=1 Tax=Junco hyemalis TaxID=40217 RepID=A0A8C5IB78_JUNHY
MSDKAYDYLIVGAGLFGATFAYLAKKAGKKVLVIDKNPISSKTSMTPLCRIKSY